MRRPGTRTTTTSTAAVILVAATLSLPAAAGPDEGAEVVVRPSSVASGGEFTVEVSGCTGGQRVQIQIDPPGLVSGAICDGAVGAPGFAAVAFLAGGPLSEPGPYEVVVLESAREIGRSSLEVVGPRVAEDKRVAKTRAEAAEELDEPDDAPTSTSVPVAAAPDVPAVEPGTLEDPAAEPETTPAPADGAAEPEITPAPQDPAAEPSDVVEEPLDPAAEPLDPAAEPEVRTVAPVVPTTAVSEVAEVVDGDDGDLAATGAGSSTPLAVLAALALVAGAGLVALTRRRA